MTKVGLDMPVDVRIDERFVVVTLGDAAIRLHPLWLRERDLAAGTADPTNGQRLFEPQDVQLDLRAVDVVCCADRLRVTFCDGHVAELDIEQVLVDAGLKDDTTACPSPVAWAGSPVAPTTVDWSGLRLQCETEMIAALTGFFVDGFFTIANTPPTPGALHEVAAPFGAIWSTFFGDLFDVRSVPDAVDLAYTSLALTAHTDQPYGEPVPQVQLLHAIDNGADGGDSLLVDGLAVAAQLRVSDPAAYAALSSVDTEYRYDCGTVMARSRSPILEHRRDGTLAAIRYSPRLDFAPITSEAVLDDYYRGRNWLASEMNGGDNAYRFRLDAGDVLVMDNRRLLHGRTSFVPASGSRHLQGGYLPYDGFTRAWRLAQSGRDR